MSDQCVLGSYQFFIDLDPLRASLSDCPQKYRWNFFGYHLQTNNRDNFLLIDFGLMDVLS
jgi:hypothetical protein